MNLIYSTEEAILLTIVLYSLTCFLFILITLFIKKSFLHPNILFIIIYYYASAGPILANLIYETSLPLVVYDKIPESLIVFTIAVSSFCLGSFVTKIRTSKIVILPEESKSKFIKSFSSVVFFINIVGLSILIYYLDVVLSFNKNTILAYGNFAIFHRLYLLSMFVLLPVYFYYSFLINLNKKFVALNFLIYIIYMLLTQERDFVLLFISIIILVNFLIKKLNIYKISIYSSLLLLVFSGLFFIRYLLAGGDSNTSILENMLNQGSNITIVSQIVNSIDSGGNYLYGYTFFQSIVNLTPSFIYRLGTPLSDWFVSNFFPTSSSGYGFGLEAEAYLNGGYLIVAILFSILGYFIDSLYLNMRNRNIISGAFFSFFFPFFLYCLRGDSLMLFKGSLFGIILIFTIYIFFTKGRIYYKNA